MSYDPIVYVCLVLGLSSALVAGVFQSFSDFVMRGLGLAGNGREAMVMINRTVLRSIFLVMLLGIVPLSLALAVYGRVIQSPAGGWVTAAAILYCGGVFLVTMIGNVPMNKRLDRLQAEDPAADAYWCRYGIGWTRLNHVRTLASLSTAACYFMSALTLAAGQG